MGVDGFEHRCHEGRTDSLPDASLKSSSLGSSHTPRAPGTSAATAPAPWTHAGLSGVRQIPDFTVRFTAFIFILCIAAFLREHKLWRRDASEIKGPTEMHGYYEEDPTTINVRFSLRFIDDHQVEMYGNGKV